MILTASLYTPFLIRILSPASAALTAPWIVRKSQRPFLRQTVCVSNGPLGLGSTLPGSFGSG